MTHSPPKRQDQSSSCSQPVVKLHQNSIYREAMRFPNQGNPYREASPTVSTSPIPLLTQYFSSDALYTEDGFKVPTMLSSRTLRRSSSAATQAARMSRVRSQSRIYMPPPAAPSVSRHGLSRSSSVTRIDEAGSAQRDAALPVKKLTPGRRGEKRKRPLKQQLAEEEEKRRRAGKISAEGGLGVIVGSPNVADSATIAVAGTANNVPEMIPVDDEDIFGNVNRIEDTGASQSATTKPRSAVKSEIETKNKAVRRFYLFRSN